MLVAKVRDKVSVCGRVGALGLGFRVYVRAVHETAIIITFVKVVRLIPDTNRLHAMHRTTIYFLIEEKIKNLKLMVLKMKVV